MTGAISASNSDVLDEQPHILVIDNDRHICRAMERLLQRQGYRVSVASTLASARRRAAEERPHLALVDVRMRDNNDPDDKSGLELAEELNPAIVKVILTAYRDFDSAIETLTPRSEGKSLVVSFIEKGGSKEPLPIIQRAIEQHVQINFDLEIEWKDDLTADDYARVIDAGRPVDFIRADLIDVLRRLFRKAQAIQVFPLSQDLKTYQSSPSGAVLLRVVQIQGGVRTPSRAVKIAVWDKIEGEIDAYEEFVKDFTGFRAARIQQHTRMHCLGGIEYTFVGAEEDDLDDFASLRRYYKEHDIDEIKQVLSDLFDNVYKFWRQSIAGPRQEHDLRQLYFIPLKADMTKLQRAVQDLFERLGAWADWNRDLLQLPGLPLDLPNPLPWLKRWLADDKNVKVQTWQGITHGDLHGENVLVHENRCWLIDFYRTGRGHYLRDIIELETDIKFALLPHIDTRLLLAFEARLLSPEFFTREEKWVAELDNPDLDKAYRILFFLRSKAGELSDGGLDAREYFHALLYQTINILRLNIIDRPQKIHALSSAASICKRLETWDQPWPVPHHKHEESDHPDQPAFNTAVIRQLLSDAFDDEGLSDFCFDYFSQVYEGFTSSMSKSQKIRRLIDHCSRHRQLDKLLAQVRQANPSQYDHYESQLQS